MKKRLLSCPDIYWEEGKIPEGTLIACDTETTGLNPYKGDRVFLYSFANTAGECTVIWNDPENKKMLKEFFANDKIKKIFHNAKFDMKMIENEDIEVKGMIHDTIIMARLADENEQSYNLEKLCKKYFEFPDLEKRKLEQWFAIKRIKKDERNYMEVPEEIIYPYAAVDAWNCMRLFHWYKTPIKQMKKMYFMDIACMKYLIEIEDRGVLINKKACRERAKKLKDEMKVVTQYIKNKTGMIITPDDKRTLGFALFSAGETCQEHTEKGEPKLDKDALNKYYSSVNFIPDFINLKKLNKTHNDLKNQILGNLDSNAVLHTNFNLSKARTGRFSSSQPNLQNINKINGVREVFICRDEYTLFYFDYSQIEIKLFAHFSEDKDLIRGFKYDPKFDTHMRVAKSLGFIKNNATEKEIKEGRDKGKTLNFSMLYGAGKKKVAEQLKIDNYKAESILADYHAQFPALEELKSNLENELFDKGYLEDPFGKHYTLSVGDEYKAVNTLIQGCACNVLKQAMLKIQPLLEDKKSNLIQNIHDELVFEIHNSEQYLIKQIKEKMEDFPQFSVPIVIDIEYSETNWQNKMKFTDQHMLASHLPW